MGSAQFAITALTPACGAEDTNFSHIYKKSNTVVSKHLHANEELGYSNSVVDRRLLLIKFKSCIQLHGLCILISV
jgi:hypothetical protein